MAAPSRERRPVYGDSRHLHPWPQPKLPTLACSTHQAIIALRESSLGKPWRTGPPRRHPGRRGGGCRPAWSALGRSAQGLGRGAGEPGQMARRAGQIRQGAEIRPRLGSSETGQKRRRSEELIRPSTCASLPPCSGLSRTDATRRAKGRGRLRRSLTTPPRGGRPPPRGAGETGALIVRRNWL